MRPSRVPLGATLAAMLLALAACAHPTAPDSCPSESSAPSPTLCRGTVAGLTFKLDKDDPLHGAVVLSFRPTGRTDLVPMQTGTPDPMALEPFARAVLLMARSIRWYPAPADTRLTVTRRPDTTSAIITAVDGPPLAPAGGGRPPCWTYFTPGQPGTGTTGCVTAVVESAGRIHFTVQNERVPARKFTIPATVAPPLREAALALLLTARDAQARFVAYCVPGPVPVPGGCPAGDIGDFMIDNQP